MTGAGALIYRRTCQGAANALPASAPGTRTIRPSKLSKVEACRRRRGKVARRASRTAAATLSQSLNLPPNSSVTYKATGFINGNSGTVISNAANVSVPAGVSDPNTADNTATDKDTIQ